jgi:hypothetical protein
MIAIGLALLPGAMIFVFGAWQERLNEPTILNLHLHPLALAVAIGSFIVGLPWCLVAFGWAWRYRRDARGPFCGGPGGGDRPRVPWWIPVAVSTGNYQPV